MDNETKQPTVSNPLEDVVMCDAVLELKRNLCVKLKMQKDIMEQNARLMKEIYPSGNHLELLGAAKITGDWIECIEKEKGIKGVFV